MQAHPFALQAPFMHAMIFAGVVKAGRQTAENLTDRRHSIWQGWMTFTGPLYVITGRKVPHIEELPLGHGEIGGYVRWNSVLERH